MGPPCGHHGPYTFYKSFRYGSGDNKRVLTLGEFFVAKIDENIPICIGDLQLVWDDKNNGSQPLCSVRLYFAPEHTPDGRKDYHGEVNDFIELYI